MGESSSFVFLDLLHHPGKREERGFTMRERAKLLKVPLLASFRPWAPDHTLTSRSICPNRSSIFARTLTTSALKREFALPTLTSQGTPAENMRVLKFGLQMMNPQACHMYPEPWSVSGSLGAHVCAVHAHVTKIALQQRSSGCMACHLQTRPSHCCEAPK